MAAGAIAAHAAAINALKASGVVVRMDPHAFLAILERTDRPLVVVALGGVFRKHVRYLTSYRGLAFYTQSEQALTLPRSVELVQAKSISIPDV